MLIDQRGSEVLPRPECQRLLALHAGGVGRLGFTANGGLIIHPINYRLVDGDIVVQIGDGLGLDAARRNEVVAFEVDEVDEEQGVAWSVLVRGMAEPLTEIVEPRRPAPLVPEPGSSFVRIRTGILSGRRFRLYSA